MKKPKKMKITWKKQSKVNHKKRPLAAISNLPFVDEDEDERPTSTIEAKVEEEGKFTSPKSLDSPATQQLAHSFQAQGDKLAEVLAVTFFPSLQPLLRFPFILFTRKLNRISGLVCVVIVWVTGLDCVFLIRVYS